MSVMYKAQIVVGFELTEDWNEIVSEEFYEKYEEYFIETSFSYCDGPQLFGVVADEVDEGRFIEYSDYIAKEDNDILNEFIHAYPGAAVYHSTSNYLVCKEN